MPRVDAHAAVQRLEATGRKRATAVRCIGYAALIQATGWEGIGQYMPASAINGLRTAFDEAGIDATRIAFPEGPICSWRGSSVRVRTRGRAQAARRLLGKS
jgi:hypothetical protein